MSHLCRAANATVKGSMMTIETTLGPAHDAARTAHLGGTRHARLRRLTPRGYGFAEKMAGAKAGALRIAVNGSSI